MPWKNKKPNAMSVGAVASVRLCVIVDSVAAGESEGPAILLPSRRGVKARRVRGWMQAAGCLCWPAMPPDPNHPGQKDCGESQSDP